MLKQYTCMQLEIFFLMKIRGKKGNPLYITNGELSTVSHNDITDSGGIAKLKMSIIRIY